LTNFARKAAFLLLAVPAVALAQRISFGIIGGTNLSRDFESYGTYFLAGPSETQPTFFKVYSDTSSFIIGPTFEVRVAHGFSVEIEAVHRNMTLKGSLTRPSGSTEPAFQDVVGAWEWPVLAKYRIQSGRLHPFDFICIQEMTRSAGPSATGKQWTLLESQELELTYANRKENYRRPGQRRKFSFNSTGNTRRGRPLSSMSPSQKERAAAGL
jgi:hypothetical protein